MNRDRLTARLGAIHATLIGMLRGVSDDEYRNRYHDHLSPLGWHVGHTLFVENLWLRERVLEAQPADTALSGLYIPENCPHSERGGQLPPKNDALRQIRKKQQDNIALFKAAPSKLLRHELMRQDYLLKFLIQHHAQHIETMRMIKTQMFARKGGGRAGKGLTQAAAITHAPVCFGNHQQTRVGGNDNWSFDNELPQQEVAPKAFAINRTPVTNAQYLAFIRAGGYRNTEHWDRNGRRWLAAAKVSAPDGWFCDARGSWHQTHCDGSRPLAPDEPVHGISHYEARAFAAYANARLPHEYEWEIAAHTGQLEKMHCVWEWCDNTFHPYPDFRPFPYPEYSIPAFDDKHYALRGASRFSEAECRRISFRNFHTREKRHIFAGVRLAFDR